MEGCLKSRVYPCNICGKIVSLSQYWRDQIWVKKMNADSVCFECAYWLDLLAHPKDSVQIINGQYFSFPPVIKSDGRIRHILTHGGEIITSTEYFNYGHIPERFRDKFPNTANFIPLLTYRMLLKNQGFVCDRKGCWDRKHCYWYIGEMDWNVIPPSHKPGEEKCPIFINTYNPQTK